MINKERTKDLFLLTEKLEMIVFISFIRVDKKLQANCSFRNYRIPEIRGGNLG